ncbi:MAG: SGNH/GDSL hydrolase family protein [Candidatus Limnocylindrales bacterium]
MALRYVALGDSYTIGTSVAGADRWPDQLVEVLAHEEPRLELVANLARNGWTSGDVIRGQLPQLGRLVPQFASLLIGVNDVVQHVPPQTYRVNLARILDDLQGRLPRDRILAVTTPDYTVTPAGASFGDPDVQRAGIERVNAILAEETVARGIGLVDIFDISARAAVDRSLVATDGLHPSGAQYALWVARIAPVVAAMLAAG